MPIFLFSLGDFALRISARSSRADFNSFSKRSHHVTRGISSSLGSFGIGTVEGCTRGVRGRSILPYRPKVFTSRFHVSEVPPVAAFRIRLPPFPPPFQKPALAQKQREVSRDSTAPTHRPSIPLFPLHLPLLHLHDVPRNE